MVSMSGSRGREGRSAAGKEGRMRDGEVVEGWESDGLLREDGNTSSGLMGPEDGARG